MDLLNIPLNSVGCFRLIELFILVLNIITLVEEKDNSVPEGDQGQQAEVLSQPHKLPLTHAWHPVNVMNLKNKI